MTGGFKIREVAVVEEVVRVTTRGDVTVVVIGTVGTDDVVEAAFGVAEIIGVTSGALVVDQVNAQIRPALRAVIE